MPGVAKHKKTKTATVLIKKTHAFTTYPKCYKSYKPLYEKIKSNNRYLAKALSKEKQENNLLFNRNVALDAENQELIRLCNKRDKIMSTMLTDAKNMVKMLVTATGYLTNYISSCQAFTSRNILDMRLSCNSAKRRQSSQRLSIKSPARGIVKPMVSGHTITKPVISLRRINVQRANHPSNLSAITESPVSPPRNEITDEADHSETPPTNRQNRYESKRVCRMPERLTTTSSRISEENEQNISKRQSKRSGQPSEQPAHSQTITSRSAENHYTNSEYLETLGNPMVKLNDVSKLLQNSQTINVRTLTEDDFEIAETPVDSDDIMNSSDNNVVMPKTKISINISRENINDSTTPKGKEAKKKFNSSSCFEQKKKRKTKDGSSNIEDPLEGPSWLFDGHQTELTTGARHGHSTERSMLDVSLRKKSRDHTTDHNSHEEQNVSLPSLKNISYFDQHNSSVENEDDTDSEEDKENSFCSMHKSSNMIPKKIGQQEEDVTTNLSRFITRRRGRQEINDDDVDDFTLMISQRPNRKQQFDINELRMPEVPTNDFESEATRKQHSSRPSDMNNLELPILECSNIVPKIRSDTEPEITGKIQKRIPNCPTAMAFNSSMTENMGRTTIYNIMCNDETIKLPLLTDEEFYKDAMNKDNKNSHTSKKSENQERKLSDYEDDTMHTLTHKKKGKQKTKSLNGKDPSSAKVILQKLSECHVMQRSPAPENDISQDSICSKKRSYVSLTAGNYSDSDCSSASTLSKAERPRRRGAPTNLREPCLNKKLRRDI